MSALWQHLLRRTLAALAAAAMACAVAAPTATATTLEPLDPKGDHQLQMVGGTVTNHSISHRNIVGMGVDGRQYVIYRNQSVRFTRWVYVQSGVNYGSCRYYLNGVRQTFTGWAQIGYSPVTVIVDCYTPPPMYLV